MTLPTSQRLTKSLKNIVKWATDEHPRSLVWLDDYLSGKGNLDLACKDLFDSGMREVDKSLLTVPTNQKTKAMQHMAHAFARMIVSKAIAVNQKNGTHELAIGNLDSFTRLLLGAIATGQPQLVPSFYKTLLAGISGGYGVGDGHNRRADTLLRYAAFGLAIISDWLGQEFDLDKHALPRDPAWGQLVAFWREPDPEKLLPILLNACDTHIERIALTEREVNSGLFEFGSEFEAVYPIEILAILRLRDLIGLPNPPWIDHPLMQSPYAALTCRPGMLTERDELLQRFLMTAYQRDPQAVPLGLTAG